MKKRYALSILILFIAFILTACGNDDSEDDSKDKEEAKTEEKDEKKEEAGQSEAKAEEQDNSGVAADESEEDPEVGSRLNPVPFDHPITVNTTIDDKNKDSESYEAELEITILEVLRGQEAEEMLKMENQQESTLENGYEWVAVKAQGRVVDADTEEYSLRFTGDDFDFVSSEGKVYQQEGIMEVPDELNEELYNGAEASGYFIGQVEKQDDFKLRFNSEKDPVFFDSK